MNTLTLAHGTLPRADIDSPRRTTTPPGSHELVGPVRQAVLCVRQFLLSSQCPDGSWRRPVRGDAKLASQLIFLMAQADDWDDVQAGELARAIRNGQTPDGGWASYPGGPIDVSTSVQAYLALKLFGEDPAGMVLRRARAVIRRAGGADQSDMQTRYWLALFGQIPYDACLPLPPEGLFLPRRWVEGEVTTAALAVIWSHRPVIEVEANLGVRELFVENPNRWAMPLAHRIVNRLERWGLLPLRQRALDKAEARIRDSDYDAMPWSTVWLTVARDALGHDRAGLAAPAGKQTDTACASGAVLASGCEPSERQVAESLGWLMRSEPSSPASANSLAPLLDCWQRMRDLQAGTSDALPPSFSLFRDDAAVDHEPVSIDQIKTLGDKTAAALVRLQRSDGGWSACGRTASSPCVTGTAVAALARWSCVDSKAVAARATSFLRNSQRADGSWDSETGVRFVHGTSAALRGLLAADTPAADGAVAAGVEWLLCEQLPCGGWGETPVELSGGQLPRASATQTAWAIQALVAAGRVDGNATRRAIQFLVDTQRSDGTWDEPQYPHASPDYTGWLQNELAVASEALTAMSNWLVAFESDVDRSGPPRLRLVGA